MGHTAAREEQAKWPRSTVTASSLRAYFQLWLRHMSLHIRPPEEMPRSESQFISALIRDVASAALINCIVDC